MNGSDLLRLYLRLYKKGELLNPDPDLGRSVPAFRGYIKFNIEGNVLEHPIEHSGWLANHFRAFEYTKESLSLEDFITDIHQFFRLAGFIKLLETRIDEKPVYSEPLDIGTESDLDIGLEILKDELYELVKNKSYPRSISIQAQTKNDDFFVTMDVHYEQKHRTKSYAVVSWQYIVPSEYLPLEDETNEQFRERIFVFAKALSDNGELGVVEKKYVDKIVSLLKTYADLVKQSFCPDKMNVEVLANGITRWSSDNE